MKAHASPIENFLTEGERRIAEQVKRLRDLNARPAITGGGSRHRKSEKIQFSARNISRSNVKDSHDRYA